MSCRYTYRVDVTDAAGAIVTSYTDVVVVENSVAAPTCSATCSCWYAENVTLVALNKTFVRIANSRVVVA